MARSALTARCLRRVSAVGLVASLSSSLCGCDGIFVNLGSSQPLVTGGAAGSAGSNAAGSLAQGGSSGAAPSGAWQQPELLFAQEELRLVLNPTLTDDEQYLFYTEQLSGDDQPVGIYRRTAQGSSWGARTQVMLGVDMLDASSPAISADGNELWFGQNVDGGLGATDIWLSRLEGDVWSAPEHPEAPLNSASDDVPRPPAVGGTLMPLSSRRHGGERYQIYLAARSSAQEPWQDVSQELLGTINSDAFESVDGFLSADGLTLYFASTRNAGRGSDLFVAERGNSNEAFAEPTALDDLNTGADERDPWLGATGHLYFTSDRATADYYGQYAIYRSQRLP